MKLTTSILSGLFFICTLTFLGGCSDNDENEIEPQLSIDPQVSNIIFSADGNTATYNGSAIDPSFAITTNQASWEVVSPPEATWLSVAKNQDQTGFTVSAGPNNEFTPRPGATITVSAEDAAPVVITVTQQAKPIPELSVTPHIERMEFSLDGSKLYSEGAEINSTFLVTSGQPSWEVELLPATASQWFTLVKEPDNSGFTVSASANNTVDRPMATIRLTAEDAISVEIVVTQQAIPSFQVGDFWPDPDAVYKNKVLVSGTAAQGIVYWLDPAHANYRDGSSNNGIAYGTKGRILSLDYGSALEWSTKEETTNAKDPEGLVNMATVKSFSPDFSEYPAFAWVHAKNNPATVYTSGATDIWYLPSRVELDVLYKVWNPDRKFINNKISMAGGHPLGNYSYYWSSQEVISFSQVKATVMYFNDGAGSIEYKHERNSVRAIRNFN